MSFSVPFSRFFSFCYHRMQSMGKVPTISVEKTDFATVYLCKESLNAEIVTAKSSSVNINVPDEENGFVSTFCLFSYFLIFLVSFFERLFSDLW